MLAYLRPHRGLAHWRSSAPQPKRRSGSCHLASTYPMQSISEGVALDLRQQLIVRVTAPSTGLTAHARLDGDPEGVGFTELRNPSSP